MLGGAFWAIIVLDFCGLGCAIFPWPFGDLQTIEDAIGHCIAWSYTHVSF